MAKENAELTLYVLAPLPVLAVTIYYVNTIINRKSDRIQALVISIILSILSGISAGIALSGFMILTILGILRREAHNRIPINSANKEVLALS